MKRILLTITVLFVLLAAVWVAGPLVFQGNAVYTVAPRSEGKSALVLRIERPGLFVDVTGAAAVPGAFSPWPGSGRQRVVTFFRGPMELTLAEGVGPFDLSDLPAPAALGMPDMRLPAGWTQYGHHAGHFTKVEGSPVAVALPADLPGQGEAVEKVRKLYAAAETLFGRPPVRERLAVVAGPGPEHLAVAVTELWVPDYATDAAWLETGAAQLYAVKLLDQLKLWTDKERDVWERKYQAEKPYALAIWLDVSLRLNRTMKVSLNDLLAKSGPGANSEQVKALVNELGGLAPADHLERMLKGVEPLPVQK